MMVKPPVVVSVFIRSYHPCGHSCDLLDGFSIVLQVLSSLPFLWIARTMEFVHNNESSIGTTLPEAGIACSKFFITTKYRSRDIQVNQEEVRDSSEKVHIWKVGALCPIHQCQLSDIQYQKHWCQQLYHSTSKS